MTKYIGRRLNVGVAKETSRGAGAAPTYLLPRTGFSFADKATTVHSTASLGHISDSDGSLVTSRYSQGNVEAEVRSKSIGLILYALMGTCETTGPTDSAYTHSFSIANTNTHQSLSFVVSDVNSSYLYKLVMIDNFELTAEMDSYVKFSADFIAKQGTSTGLSIPALASESRFSKKHISFKVADNIAGLGAATKITLKSLTLTVNKNVATSDVLGTAEPEDLMNRQFSVEGEIQLNYEDETWKGYAVAATPKAVQIQLTNADDTIGASTNPSLTIQMPKVYFFDWEPDYSLDEIVTQTISFKAVYDSANTLNMISSMQLVNDVASY